jgi:hypothetical protein
VVRKRPTRARGCLSIWSSIITSFLLDRGGVIIAGPPETYPATVVKLTVARRLATPAV